MLNVGADFVLVTALLFVYAWEPGQPLRTLLYLVVLEAALFFRLRGGLLVAALSVPVFAAVEAWRESEFGYPSEIESIVLRGLIALTLGGVVGRLVDTGARPGARRRGACRGGRAAPRRARTTHRRPRGHEPRCPRARLLARPRRGVCGLRPGAARPSAIRPSGDPARRGEQRPRDGDRRDCGRGVPLPRDHDPRRGVDSRAGDRPGLHDLPGGHFRPPVSRRGAPARARGQVARARAAAARVAGDRRARDLPQRARGLPRRGDRARNAARPARRQRGAEPARLRGRASHRGRASPPVRTARGLRLTRLARAAEPDGGGDRLRADAAGAVARAPARAA